MAKHAALLNVGNTSIKIFVDGDALSYEVWNNTHQAKPTQVDEDDCTDHPHFSKHVVSLYDTKNAEIEIGHSTDKEEGTDFISVTLHDPTSGEKIFQGYVSPLDASPSGVYATVDAEYYYGEIQWQAAS